MAVKEILSAQNEYIKKLLKLKTKKYRDEMKLFMVEGERSCFEAASSDFEIESIVVTKGFYEKSSFDFSPYTVILTNDKIFASLSDTKTPQGIMAILKIPQVCESSKSRLIYCDCIQDPGNAGTIIRSADAFGFDGVVFSKGSVDVFSPKVIRSSMGSVFHIDILTDKDISFLSDLKKKGVYITASALSRESSVVGKMKVLKDQVFVIGNEGAGVSSEILELADEVVYIPMPGKAESLNAGVAASILMYEVMRRE